MICKPEGPLTANIALVGEAPGATEEALGRPFVGGSGNLLDQMLSSAGINRKECYLTNVMQVRPPSNNFGYFYHDKKRSQPKEELVAGWKRLREELDRVRPNIIVALGNEPLRALTNLTGITKWRGSCIPSPAGKVFATLHPAAVLRMYSFRPIVELDLRKAKRLSLTKDHVSPVFKFKTFPSFEDVLLAIDGYRRNMARIAFDIETTERRTRCLGIADGPRSAICIPFTRNIHTSVDVSKNPFLIIPTQPSQTSDQYWPIEEELAIIKALGDLFADPKVEKIAQNFPFDSSILAKDFGFHIENLHMDTMIAQHVAYCEFPKSLDFMCSIYTDVGHYSEHNAAVDLDEFIYNCTDACVTWEVHEKIEAELKQMDLWGFYKNHVEPTMLAVTLAQNRGVNIDSSVQQRLIIQQEGIKRKDFALLNDLAGFPLNANSPKQVQTLLYDKLKMKPVYDRKTGSRTLGAKAMASLRRKYPKRDKLIHAILTARTSTKLVSFVSAKPAANGRMEFTYNTAGTVNGRLSASQTLWKTGQNIQQIPNKRGKHIRRMYIPSNGKTFMKADLSQAEARVTVWLAGATRLIERFAYDPAFDIHRWNAASIFGVSEENVTKEQRNTGKPGVHGGNYRMQPQTAANTFDVSYGVAKKSLETYWRAFPELRRWWTSIEKEINEKRFLVSPHFGRRHQFYDRISSDVYRQGYAFKPQSCVGDIINRAFFVLTKSFLAIDAFPLLQIHDEILSEVPNNKDAVLKAARLIRQEFEVPLNIPNPLNIPCVIPADISVGPNWCDCVPLKEWLDNA